MSERSVRQKVQIGNGISEDVAKEIKDTQIADNQSQLLKISRLEPETQRKVIAKLKAGEPTVKTALKKVKTEEHDAARQADNGKSTASEPLDYNKVYCIDSLEGLERIAEKTVDVIVTPADDIIREKYTAHSDSKLSLNYRDFLNELAEASMRILKEDGSLYMITRSKSPNLWPYEVVSVYGKHFKLQNILHWVTSVYNDMSADSQPVAPLGNITPSDSDCFHNNAHEFIFHFTKHGNVKIDKMLTSAPKVKKSDSATKKRKGKNLLDVGNVWYIPEDMESDSKASSDDLSGKTFRDVHTGSRYKEGYAGRRPSLWSRPHSHRLQTARHQLHRLRSR